MEISYDLVRKKLAQLTPGTPEYVKTEALLPGGSEWASQFFVETEIEIATKEVMSNELEVVRESSKMSLTIAKAKFKLDKASIDAKTQIAPIIAFREALGAVRGSESSLGSTRRGY